MEPKLKTTNTMYRNYASKMENEKNEKTIKTQERRF